MQGPGHVLPRPRARPSPSSPCTPVSGAVPTRRAAQDLVLRHTVCFACFVCGLVDITWQWMSSFLSQLLSYKEQQICLVILCIGFSAQGLWRITVFWDVPMTSQDRSLCWKRPIFLLCLQGGVYVLCLIFFFYFKKIRSGTTSCAFCFSWFVIWLGWMLVIIQPERCCTSLESKNWLFHLAFLGSSLVAFLPSLNSVFTVRRMPSRENLHFGSHDDTHEFRLKHWF